MRTNNPNREKGRKVSSERKSGKPSFSTEQRGRKRTTNKDDSDFDSFEKKEKRNQYAPSAGSRGESRYGERRKPRSEQERSGKPVRRTPKDGSDFDFREKDERRSAYSSRGTSRSQYGDEKRKYPSDKRGFEKPVRRNSKDDSDFDSREKDERRSGYSSRSRSNSQYGDEKRDFRSDKRGFEKPIKRSADYDPNAKYSKKKQIEFKKKQLNESDSIRLNRFLANAGICSRREADEYIQAGVVTVNGEIVTELGTKVSHSDKVLFHDQLVRTEKKIYILLNKPKDCVTTSDDPQERFTVMDIVKNACNERVYPVGRLDRNTTGVLLLTNDGKLAEKLTHPKYNKKKIYHVFLDKPLTKADMETIAKGIELEDGEIHADEISYVHETDKKQIGIEIHSGRNRIVRRIFEHFGYKVEKLDRVYFAGLTKKNVPRGKFRHLTEKEINMLNMGAFQ